MLVMSDPDRSLQLFNLASDMKRNGSFDEALKLYVESVRVYPDAPNWMEAFNAMGKVFYLKMNFAAAVKCYTVYNRLCVLKTPLILQDYQAMLRNDNEAKKRLLEAFYDLATHWGWSHAQEQIGKEFYSLNSANELIYCDSLLGRRPYSAVSVTQQILYNQYQNGCRAIGFQLIFADFQKMLDTPTSTKTECQQYINQILDIVEALSDTNVPASSAPINDVHANNVSKSNVPTNHTNNSERYDLENLPYDSLGFDSAEEMDDYFEDLDE